MMALLTPKASMATLMTNEPKWDQVPIEKIRMTEI